MTFRESSIRVINFTGKTDDHKIWESKFLAKAGKIGYKKILLGKVKIPSDVEYATALAVAEATRSTSQLETISAYETNSVAYADLILAMDGETNNGKVAWSLVDGSKTSENPDGDAALAFKRLRENISRKQHHHMFV